MIVSLATYTTVLCVQDFSWIIGMDEWGGVNDGIGKYFINSGADFCFDIAMEVSEAEVHFI